ncbi:hypothetical protein RKLH11_2772 [Rhodobacteraceae bacterium KLH11]|nr:hypothetical protein RKLH11_2772 [Rhodobacteraceae bacterium KLH11]
MLSVSHDDICNALGIVRGTSRARLCDVPWTQGANGTHLYRLTDVLPTIKDRQREGVPRLFELAQADNEGSLWVGDDGVRRSRRLENWLVGGQVERLFGARVAFTNALAASVQSSALFGYLEALRCNLILADPVLKWTVLGDANALPPFEHWAVSYAITNARPNEIENEMRVAA